VGKRQERVDDRVAAFGIPDQLLELIAPRVGALHRPPPAGLDRRWRAAFGDLAGHATLGQLRTGLAAVIAAVQMDRRLLG
jgi:hypothetical protein